MRSEGLSLTLAPAIDSPHSAPLLLVQPRQLRNASAMAPRFVVCMSYDFDALSGRWRSRAPAEPSTPTHASSGRAG